MALPFQAARKEGGDNDDGISVDYSQFTVTIPSGQHTRTAEILASIDDEAVARMKRALAEWAPFLLWGGGTPDLPLMMSLHQAWKRRKQQGD